MQRLGELKPEQLPASGRGRDTDMGVTSREGKEQWGVTNMME